MRVVLRGLRKETTPPLVVKVAAHLGNATKTSSSPLYIKMNTGNPFGVGPIHNRTESSAQRTAAAVARANLFE